MTVCIIFIADLVIAHSSKYCRTVSSIVVAIPSSWPTPQATSIQPLHSVINELSMNSDAYFWARRYAVINLCWIDIHHSDHTLFIARCNSCRVSQHRLC